MAAALRRPRGAAGGGGGARARPRGRRPHPPRAGPGRGARTAAGVTAARTLQLRLLGGQVLAGRWWMSGSTGACWRRSRRPQRAGAHQRAPHALRPDGGSHHGEGRGDGSPVRVRARRARAEPRPGGRGPDRRRRQHGDRHDRRGRGRRARAERARVGPAAAAGERARPAGRAVRRGRVACGRPDRGGAPATRAAQRPAYSPTWPNGWASTNVLVSVYIRWM